MSITFSGIHLCYCNEHWLGKSTVQIKFAVNWVLYSKFLSDNESHKDPHSLDVESSCTTQLRVPCVGASVLACMCAWPPLYWCACCTCDEGGTPPGQRDELARQISQRLKAPLPNGGNGQALMLMWTNKRKPKWVKWTIICCGEVLPWNGACLLCLQPGGVGVEEDGGGERGERVCERKTHT